MKKILMILALIATGIATDAQKKDTKAPAPAKEVKKDEPKKGS